MKLVPKTRTKIESPNIPSSVLTVLIKKYTEQGLRKDGMSVDKHPSVKEKITEKDIYFLLLFLRKTRRLPKLFRSKEDLAA